MSEKIYWKINVLQRFDYFESKIVFGLNDLRNRARNVFFSDDIIAKSTFAAGKIKNPKYYPILVKGAKDASIFYFI